MMIHTTGNAIVQGGLTWLWLDSPYVIAARKLFNWAVEANNKGDVFPVGIILQSPCKRIIVLHALQGSWHAVLLCAFAHGTMLTGVTTSADAICLRTMHAS